MKQQTMAMASDQGTDFERFRKPTRRDVSLQVMDPIVPWAELVALLES